MRGANLALIICLLLILLDARIGRANHALGLAPYLLQVPDGLAERVDDARPRVGAWIALCLLLHRTRVWCADLAKINSDWDWLRM